MQLICFLKTTWLSFFNVLGGSPYGMSGHMWQDIETHENVTVTISKCMTCGKQELSFKR